MLIRLNVFANRSMYKHKRNQFQYEIFVLVKCNHSILIPFQRIWRDIQIFFPSSPYHLVDCVLLKAPHKQALCTHSTLPHPRPRIHQYFTCSKSSTEMRQIKNKTNCRNGGERQNESQINIRKHKFSNTLLNNSMLSLVFFKKNKERKNYLFVLASPKTKHKPKSNIYCGVPFRGCVCTEGWELRKKVHGCSTTTSAAMSDVHSFKWKMKKIMYNTAYSTEIRMETRTRLGLGAHWDTDDVMLMMTMALMAAGKKKAFICIMPTNIHINSIVYVKDVIMLLCTRHILFKNTM